MKKEAERDSGPWLFQSKDDGSFCDAMTSDSRAHLAPGTTTLGTPRGAARKQR